MHADLENYHSSRYGHTRRISEDAATILRGPSIPHNLFRLVWLPG